MIRQAEMLKALGVKPTKQLPQGLMELAQQETLELEPSWPRNRASPTRLYPDPLMSMKETVGKPAALSIPDSSADGERDPQLCHPDRSGPGFPTSAALAATTCAAFSKESRMKFANATNLDRKSGVA